MPVKIRLQRKGKKRKPFYHIIIADSRSPRDGRFIEKIGSYNPLTVPATIELDREKAFEWIGKGAQPTETVSAILRFKGLGYRKHLLRGVGKGALTEEQAEKMYNDWIEAKEAKITKRRAKALEEKMAFHARVAGLDIPFKAPEKVVPKVQVEEKEVEEAPVAVEEVAAPAAPDEVAAVEVEAAVEEAAKEEE